MVADHCTKPLQGNAFCKYWALIMNIDPNIPDCHMSWKRLIDPSPQECVGHKGNKMLTIKKDTEPGSVSTRLKKQDTT